MKFVFIRLALVSLLSANAFAFVSPGPALHKTTPLDGATTTQRFAANNFFDDAKDAVINVVSILCVSAALTLNAPPPAVASSYDAMTAEQRTVAEAWRLVDFSFIDRTFNGQDWFKLRQDNVGRKYKSMEEAQGAISTMIGTLGDKYTRYLSPSKYQSLVDAATGTLAGVGIEISTNKEGRVIASDVEPTSPAKVAGIEPKDIFVEVDGAKFDATSTPDDVALKLRGPEGSKVGVVMERDGKTLDYIVTRQNIKITSVRSYMTSVGGVGKVGVIRVKSFSGTTADSVQSELDSLKKKGAKAIALDLRGDPGGLLPGGVDTASLFLDANKPVVFVVNNKGVVDAQSTYKTGVDLETPLVIFVDKGTASAAEVFTAALQENGRATVVGEQTFGKGIVQTIKPMSNNNGGIAVTVAKYETPQHHDINKRGITVDMETSVDCAKDDASSCLPSSAFKAPEQS
jgi:carboxyl-terminal processing protease